MKKVIIFIILFFLLFGLLNAQSVRSKGFKFGLNFAYRAFPHVDMEVLTDSAKKTGINAGVFIEFFDNNIINLILEVQYKMMRPYEYYIEEYYGDLVPANSKRWELRRLEYVSFPLLIKIGYKIGKIRPYGVVGPRADVLLCAEYYDENGFRDSLWDEFKWYSIGMDFGFGAEIDFIRWMTFSPEFRFSSDFTYSKGNYHIEGKNRAYEFIIGMGFM